MNIWNQSTPLFILAPMEDVTDTVFRRVVARLGKPDIFFTEFTNVEGLCSPGKRKVAHRLLHTEQETPLVAQIWGSEPDNFHAVARELAEAGFAGIDINMGCPDRQVVRRGQCSGLIQNRALAAEIIAATKAGAGALPVSVKTRCGLNSWITDEWIGFLLGQGLAAITIHGRIAKEMSKHPADWQQIGRASRLRDQLAPSTKIIGNGDVSSYQDGLDKLQPYDLDGIMIGRGIFGNPWIFNPQIDPQSVPLSERLAILTYHVSLFHETWFVRGHANGKVKNYNLLKKFFKIYLSGPAEAVTIKERLMRTASSQECLEVLDGMKMEGSRE